MELSETQGAAHDEAMLSRLRPDQQACIVRTRGDMPALDRSFADLRGRLIMPTFRIHPSGQT